MQQLTFIPKQKSDDWDWEFADYPPKNGLKAFSCFSCGGGSTMGYKLCGVDVVGNVEIDVKQNEIYKLNHNPKYNYCMDIREFNRLTDLPDELYHLDILDGSPPCTTFSMSGQREDSWGKEKVFREGQAKQTLDDLSFVFIDTVAKLRPKVVIMENVEGLTLGAAWSYVQRIYQEFKDIGYSVRHELLKGEHMGVPQKRHRVFFVATRLDFDLENIDLSFDYEPVLLKDCISDDEHITPDTVYAKAIKEHGRPTDRDVSDIYNRVYGKDSGFNTNIIHLDKVCNTLTTKNNDYIYEYIAR